MDLPQLALASNSSSVEGIGNNSLHCFFFFFFKVKNVLPVAKSSSTLKKKNTHTHMKLLQPNMVAMTIVHRISTGDQGDNVNTAAL